MTKPTITYGHAFLDDADDETKYSETVNNILANEADMVIHSNKDMYELSAIPDSADDEYAYYERTLSAAEKFSTTIYPYYLFRWKTYDSSNGMGLRIKVIYTSGSEWILGETAPEYSTTWKLASGSLTSGKTVDKIQLWIDDYPDSVNDGLGHACFVDFLLFCKGVFTIPFWDDMELHLPEPYTDQPIPTRPIPLTQYVGAPSRPVITLRGTMQSGEVWGTPPGLTFYDIWVNAHKERWQWFSTGGATDEDRLINCKVTIGDLNISQSNDSKQKRRWTLPLKLYSKSTPKSSMWTGVDWLGI